MKKVTVYLTEEEVALVQSMLADKFKYLSMHASCHGDIVALKAVKHISYQLGQSRDWLGSPTCKADAKQRASTFRAINDKKTLAEILG